MTYWNMAITYIDHISLWGTILKGNSTCGDMKCIASGSYM